MPSISTLSSLGFSSPFDPKLLPLSPTALSHSFHTSYWRSELGFTDGAHYAFFSLSNPTTRNASKKSWRWMGRIFPASTCIKSSTSRIYASLASLAHASYRTHRRLLTQTFDIRTGVMLTAIQNHFHIVLVQIHFLTLQQDLEQLKTRSLIRQRNLRPILPALLHTHVAPFVESPRHPAQTADWSLP